MFLLQCVFFSSPFWQDILVAIIGGLIGSGASVWVFYKTLRNDKIEEENKKKLFRKEKLKYFKALVINILKEVKEQTDKYVIFYASIEKNPAHDIPKPTIFPLHDLRQIHSLNKEEYYHSYLDIFGDSDESINEFKDVIAIIYYFDRVTTENEVSIRDAIRFDYDRRASIAKEVDTLTEYILTYLRHKDVTGDKLKLREIFNEALGILNKNPDNSDLEYVYNSFIYPLIKKITLGMYYEEIDEAHRVILILKKVKDIYLDVIAQNKYFAEGFKQDCDNMKKFHNDLLIKSNIMSDYKN